MNFETNYMHNHFKELDVPVIITRDTDKMLSRNERLMMRSLGTDPNVIVLSNHINAGELCFLMDGELKSLIIGFDVIIHTTKKHELV